MSQAAVRTQQKTEQPAAPARRGVRRVVADTWWIIRDCLRLHGGGVFMAISLGILGQFTMIASIGAAARYVQAVQTNKPINLTSLSLGAIKLPALPSIDPRSSLVALIAVIGALFCLVLFSALLTWWGKALGAHIVRLYEEDCTRRALAQLNETLAVTPPIRRDRDAERARKRLLLKLVTRDTRYCGRVANEMILTATPALTAVAAVAVLLFLGWLPLVVMLIAVLLVAPLYIRVNRKGMQSMMRLEVLARRDALMRAEYIAAMADTEGAVQPKFDLVDHAQTQRYLDAYETRLKMAHASLLVGNILFAMSLCAILLFFGIFHGHGIGTTVVIYMVGMQYLMYSMRNIGKHLTNISVYHPSFSRYVEFMRTRSIAFMEEPSEKAKSGIVPGDDELLDESEDY